MELLGRILKGTVRYRRKVNDTKKKYDYKLHDLYLKKLLEKAKKTEFGKKYGFKEILKDKNIYESFASRVPIYDYDKLYKEWWHKTLDNKKDITWPGKIKYFALTSGTSGAPSKRIPVSDDMIQSIKRTSLRQMLIMDDLEIEKSFFKKQMLILGGSTKLQEVNGHFEGDLSGILAKKIPLWFVRFSRPNKMISGIRDWSEKLDKMVEEAPKWDIGIISGVPAWVQLLMDKIIKRHGLNSIHDIWPNFKIYVHGGVAFEPYKESFKKLLSQDIIYLETYLASEGFIAYENGVNLQGMQLSLNKGLYFEFIPFNENNFDEDGNLRENPEVLPLKKVKEGIDYALLLSTCSGTWRYLIGDTVQFTSLLDYEIKITGRTKHFLSLCGEHLSVDNMNKAIELTSKELDVSIKEFTVFGGREDIHFFHNWFIGIEEDVEEELLKNTLDKHLHALNADYATERTSALKYMRVNQIPHQKFIDFLAQKGKLGGQHKFPRVIKGQLKEDWLSFLE